MHGRKIGTNYSFQIALRRATIRLNKRILFNVGLKFFKTEYSQAYDVFFIGRL